jgi:hypothetical protein
MAVISRTPITDRAITAATIFTRTAVAVGVPLYLYLKLDSVPTLHSSPGKLIAASVAILSAPATLYCALGALEGVVRSCIQYFNYQAYSKPEYHWDKFCKEVKTTYGLVQASVSPLAGYTFMYREWNKLGLDKDKPRLFKEPRVLKEEYVTYSTLRSIAYFLIDAGTWTLRKLKICLDSTVAQITSALQAVWKGVCWVKEKTVSAVKWTWRVTQPFRELIWNILVAVKNWSIDRLVDLWNFSKPVWKYIWNKVAVQLVWEFAIKKVIWEIALKTVVWDFLIKTVVADWILTKLVINLICETIIVKVIWPPVKFLWQKIVWPSLKWTFKMLGKVIEIAFTAIAWAVSQAFRRGR